MTSQPISTSSIPLGCHGESLLQNPAWGEADFGQGASITSCTTCVRGSTACPSCALAGACQQGTGSQQHVEKRAERAKWKLIRERIDRQPSLGGASKGSPCAPLLRALVQR